MISSFNPLIPGEAFYLTVGTCPFPILGLCTYDLAEITSFDTQKNALFYTIRVSPDQMLYSVASDLGLSALCNMD